MKKIFSIFIFLLLGCLFLSADRHPGENKWLKNILLLLKQQPQEKVYLHTDRDHYQAGDTIWLRAWEVNASTHMTPGFSRYVYVELVDRQDSIYERVKILGRDSVFAGYLALSKRRNQGEYFLRAYTYWMQNWGEDYIFKKKIRILNPEDTKVQTKVEYEKGKDGAYAVIRFSNSRNELYAKTSLEYMLDGKFDYTHTDGEGRMRVKLDTTKVMQNLFVRFRDSIPFRFERHLPLLCRDREYDVQFFPEGGSLLSGCRQRVAFKAIGADGLSREVTLQVYNKSGEELCRAKSLHKGMGDFELSVEAGETYYAVVRSEEGIEKQVPLPSVERVGLALQANVTDSLLYYRVLHGDSAQLPSSLYLLAHLRGIPLFCNRLSHLEGKMLLPVIPDGIVQFALADETGKVYSQRSCFVRSAKAPRVQLTPDRPHYGVRDWISMNVDIKGAEGEAVGGSFSVCVTDDPQNSRDSLSDHLLSYLLLSSDVKGYIEEPAWYFEGSDRIRNRSLDLLMLTQGWSRFDVSDVLQGKFPETSWYLEKGQAISGQVMNFWGKAAEGAALTLLGSNGLMQIVNTDSTGRFVIDGIRFAEGTQFALQGSSKKGRRTVEVKVDGDEFLPPSIRIPYNREVQKKEDDFLEKFSKDYYYDHGQKVYVLDEAVVRRAPEIKIYTPYDQVARYGLDSMKLASMEDTDMLTVLRELPGIDIDESGHVNHFGEEVYVMIDELEPPYPQYIEQFQACDLLSVHLLDPNAAFIFFGTKVSNKKVTENYGAKWTLVITTKKGFTPPDRSRPSLATFSLLGYQKKAEFYVPRYDIDSVRLALADTADWRPTLYWNPDVKVDSFGQGCFSFPASDSYGPYTIILEGILKDGTVFRKTRKVELK